MTATVLHHMSAARCADAAGSTDAAEGTDPTGGTDAAGGAGTGEVAAPHPVEVVAAAREQLARLRRSTAGDPQQWDPGARETVITELDGLIQELDVYRGTVLLAHREQGRWGSVGDRDFTDWRSRVTGVGRGAAARQVELADGLAVMPQVAAAVDRGELTLEHATTLARLRRQASPEVQDALASGTLDELVRQATRDGLSAPQLGTVAKRRAAQIDAAAAQRNFEAVHRRRSLSMRKHSGGLKGEFFLDAIAGDELRTALDAISGKPAKNDDRTREQRLADALTTMAGRTLQVGSDLTGAQVRPHVSLLVTEETWAGILARRRTAENGTPSAAQPTGGPQPATGGLLPLTGDPLPPLPDVPPGELEDGTPVPLGELERIMCDCEVTRVVLSAAGVPLDVGRTQRTYTKELRRAVTTRDRHCQWPSCRLRASWCEVHHVTWFSRGGRTSVDQGITLCSFHHHRVHEHDVRITVLPDGFDFHLPDGHRIGSTRRSQPPAVRLPSPATDTAATVRAAEVVSAAARTVKVISAAVPSGTAASRRAAAPRCAAVPSGTAAPGHAAVPSGADDGPGDEDRRRVPSTSTDQGGTGPRVASTHGDRAGPRLISAAGDRAGPRLISAAGDRAGPAGPDTSAAGRPRPVGTDRDRAHPRGVRRRRAGPPAGRATAHAGTQWDSDPPR